jgi:hypothetical protein
MSVTDPLQPSTAAPRTVEWRPDRTAAVVLNLVAVPLLLAGLVLFLRLATLRLPASGHAVFGLWDVLLFTVVTVLLTALLLAVHEGLHALAMRAFGARPRFGALMIAGVAPALYTTAPGHRFSRAQYLAIGLTPAAVVSVLGAPGLPDPDRPLPGGAPRHPPVRLCRRLRGEPQAARRAERDPLRGPARRHPLPQTRA